MQKRSAPGFRKGVFWRDMGVVNLRSGRPTMVLTGGAAEQLKRITPQGLEARVDLSLTDDFPLAQAIVVISAEPAGSACRDRDCEHPPVNCGPAANPLYGGPGSPPACFRGQDAAQQREHELADQRQQCGGQRLA